MGCNLVNVGNELDLNEKFSNYSVSRGAHLYLEMVNGDKSEFPSSYHRYSR